MNPSLPSLINDKLTNWFGFPEKETHIQVATSSENHPHLRTMKLYEITQEGSCVVLTHNKTLKWHDLQVSPYVAMLFVNYDFGQITVEGEAELKTKDSNEIKCYWECMPEPIQRIYTPSPGKEIPDSFGVISVRPTSWEMLEINKIDYNKSIRRKFFLKNGLWEASELRPV